MELPELKLLFNEEVHEYVLDGFKLPSVTQIMSPLSYMVYSDIPADVLAIAAERGTRVHEQVSNYVNYGILERDDDTSPYIEAFEKFESLYRPKLLLSEYKTFHRTMRYAGTIDLLGYIETDDGNGIDVIDIKCTSAYHPVLLETQVSAYEEALRSHGVKTRNKYGLQLLKTGEYRFEKLGNGYQTFLHCLAIHNTMRRELQ